MPKQRTTEDVYYRLIHDGERFDTENVLIGYMDRMRGAMEMKFASFVPIRDGGDVPFHRLRYFRSPRGLLYDRKTGIDCVFEAAQFNVEAGYGIPPNETLQLAIKESQRNREIVEYNAVQRQKRKKQRWLSSRAKTKLSLGTMSDKTSCSLSRIPVFKFNGEAWVVSSSQNECWDKESAPDCSGSLTVVSFNVLFDRFDNKEALNQEDDSIARWTALLNCIGSLKLRQVIAFQEATPRFAALLLEQEWVKRDYFTTVSEDVSTVDPDGQILLSQFPILGAVRHDFSKSKRVVICELGIYNHRLLVPSLHLTSDYRGSRVTLRNEQLATILEICRGWDQEEDLDILLVGDFNCAFEEEDREHFSSVKSFTDVWRHIWPSDPGYTFDPASNCLAALSHPDAEGNTKVHTSKRCDRMFLSPHSSWAPMQASLIKTVHQSNPDLNYDGPLSDHFGLLFEFCDVSPTDSPLGSSDESEDATIVNNPVSRGWQRETLASVFLEDGGESAFKAWRSVADAALEVLLTCTSKCGHCAVVEAGSGESGVAAPFSDVDVVIIGREHPRTFMQLLSTQLKLCEEYQDTVVRIVSASVMPCIRVGEVDGSFPPLDIHYVCSSELVSIMHPMVHVTKEEDNAKLCSRISAVEALHRFRENNAQGATSTLTLNETEERSIEAILDCDDLLMFVVSVNTSLPKSLLLTVFRRTTRCVKLWAKRHGVYGTNFGFPGGFTLSLMVAYLMQLEAAHWFKEDDKSAQQKPENDMFLKFLHRFYDFYAMFPFEQETISLRSTSESRLLDSPSTAPMTVLTPSNRNTCRYATVISVELLKNALKNTSLVLSALIKKNDVSSMSMVFLPQLKQFLNSSPQFLALEVVSNDETMASDALGFLESRIVALLHHCEVDGGGGGVGVRHICPWSSSFTFSKGWSCDIHKYHENKKESESSGGAEEKDHMTESPEEWGQEKYGGFLLLAIVSESSDENLVPPTLQKCLSDCVLGPFHSAYHNQELSETVSLSSGVVTREQIKRKK